MKSTWPPLHVIFVGFELNQHGHAASHEQASSSWPVIVHGVTSLGSFAARTGEASMRRPATVAQKKSNVVFIASDFTAALVFSTSELCSVRSCSRRPVADAKR